MEKHNAVVLGNVCRKIYHYDYFQRELGYKLQPIETRIIWEGELDNPPLKEEDSLYITDKNIEVFINRVVRSTDGGFVYHSDYQAKEIEDEISNKTKQRAEQIKLEHNAEYTNEQPTNSDSKWWQIWK